MFEPVLGNWVMASAMTAFTAVAAGWDLREKRIPNKLTLPVFFAGWIYQAMFHGWAGLGNAAAGFAVGFGVLFVLWFIGGGGGGDVKMMGALSVWMGFRLTLLVLIASTLTVVIITMGVVALQIAKRGARKTKDKYVAGSSDPVAKRNSRRILPYAVPVAIATWFVLAFKIPSLNREARAAEARPSATATQNGGVRQ
jgi:prepilin peptidase CpaA